MQHHALALAEHGADVDLCGDEGAQLHPELEARTDLSIVRWRRTDASSRGARPGFHLAGALRRVLQQSGQLLSRWLLCRRAPHVILVQTPPALPMLPLAWLCARLRRARLVIDWHNYGFAMLGLRLGREHVAVRVARAFEGFFGRRADGHLCVSAALADDLRERFAIAGAAVVRDRPTRAFRSIDRAEALRRLDGIAAALDLDLCVGTERRAVLVCPTSWGDDEDMAMLVDAIGRWVAAHRESASAFPRLAVLVTGRGPGRDTFAPRLAALDGMAVRVRMPWLATADYRSLLAAADLGLCFHRSASGLDLPMKLADMRGAGLPVCALDYAPCLGEVFEADRHGWLFADAASCAERVWAALAGFPSSASLRSMREALRESKEPDWSTEWARNAAPSLFGPSLPDLEHGQEPPVGRH